MHGRHRSLKRCALLAVLALCLVVWAPGVMAGDLPTEIEREILAAQQLGLPTAALEAKAREGLAKGVTPGRVAGVVADLRGQLEFANTLLGPMDDPARREEVLGAAAGALAAGASPSAVRNLSTLPVEVRGSALVSLGDLLSLSFGEDTAVNLIRDAARGPNGSAKVEDLATVAATLLARGLSQEAALGAVEEMAHGRAEEAKAHGNSQAGNKGNGKGGGKNK